MTDETNVPIGRIAGQLAYLFEEEPELHNATPQVLADRLNHDDRFARARERNPEATDAEVAEKVAEFEARITAHDVSEALGQLPD